MGIQLHRDFAGCGACIREVLRPSFDAEAKKVLGDRRLLAPLEVRDRPKPVDVAAVENEGVSVLFAAIVCGSFHNDEREYYSEPGDFFAMRNPMSRRFALLTALLLSASAAGQPAAQQRIRNHFDSDAHLGPPAFFDLEVLGTPA